MKNKKIELIEGEIYFSNKLGLVKLGRKQYLVENYYSYSWFTGKSWRISIITLHEKDITRKASNLEKILYNFN